MYFIYFAIIIISILVWNYLSLPFFFLSLLPVRFFFFFFFSFRLSIHCTLAFLIYHAQMCAACCLCLFSSISMSLSASLRMRLGPPHRGIPRVASKLPQVSPVQLFFLPEKRVSVWLQSWIFSLPRASSALCPTLALPNSCERRDPSCDVQQHYVCFSLCSRS